jgi:chromosomal replication initiation ATPase DnaA
MGALAEQHQRWTEVRARLESPPPRKPLLKVVEQQPDLAALYGFDFEEVDALRWKRIIREVAQQHGLTIPELLARRRRRMIVQARQLLFYRLYRETSMSLPEIGKKCGGYDHTTVIHSIRKHQERIKAAS